MATPTPSPSLSPAGSSTYSSNTLHVGDGTWDTGRDTFLLPNLVGLNFATMQYNGMGNRFAGLPEYHRLIIGHGALAAIVFLLIVPLAISFAKFGIFESARWNVKFHVYCHIVTLFLLTVVLVLGWMAVGPDRSLTNPHHGIGVAIYTLVWVQFIYGWMMSRLEKRRRNPAALTRTPTKVWLHKLLGRSIALLGLVQIPLGLTLYGSPKVLFILFALWAAILLLGYLTLDRYYFEKRPVDFGIVGPGGGGGQEYYSDYGSYLSGSRVTQDQRMRPERERSHWGRDALGAVGALGLYEAYRRRRSDRREEREQAELDAERRYRPPPPPPGAPGPPPITGSRPGSRPPSRPPGVLLDRAASRPPPGRPVIDDSRLSPASWEDEKYSEAPQRHTWRNRLWGAGAGIAAFEGARRLFGRRRREDEYVDSSYVRPPLGGAQNMVSVTDVSRVEAGQAPFSPNDPRRLERVNMAGVVPDTPTATPSRPPRRPRPSADSMSYDYEDSMADVGPGAGPLDQDEENRTLRNSIATMGAIAGFREWNSQRRQRRERQRTDRLRKQELDNEETFNRRTSVNNPYSQDAGGRRPSMSGTVMTGATGAEPALVGGNSLRPSDTLSPPLPAMAGTIPMSASGAGAPPSTVGPSISRQNVNELPQGYSFPPPPPGPPPSGNGGLRPEGYRRPEPGSLQMPTGAVDPDPSRLVRHENLAEGQSSQGHPIRDAAAAGLAGAAVGAMAERHRRSQSQSPSRYHEQQDSRTGLQRPGRQGEVTDAFAGAEANPASPPVSVKVKMHNDGRYTVRRLNEEEAEAERAARRNERRQRRRRGSIISSDFDDDAPGPSDRRYRRNGGMRPSSNQPITNVPPPPPMSSASGSRRRDSELNLPPARAPQQSESPGGRPSQGLSPPAAPGMGSGLSGGVGSPGDAGTDNSTFADNRRRRRAERTRKLEAARGNKVEFS